ncbi:MAG: hypothetical protein HY901_33360, partial [Deltaproteobacteria bacterium]|nr:hypothetical protein [Deltaproteobacteria bacterium]
MQRLRLARFVPRSLRLQSVVLLALAIGLTALLVVTVFLPRSMEQFKAELDKRGRAMAATLEKRSDLRLAIFQQDAAAATGILEAVASSDEDIEYVAILSAAHQPIASMDAQSLKAVRAERVAAHEEAARQERMVGQARHHFGERAN